jgi:hypothetical protein
MRCLLYCRTKRKSQQQKRMTMTKNDGAKNLQTTRSITDY